MDKIKEILKPNEIKLILFIILVIQFYIIKVLFFGFYGTNPNILIFLTFFIVSYSIAITLDYIFNSNKWKIGIAGSIAIALLVGFYIFNKIKNQIGGPTVCDPVHKPTACEARCKEIYNTSTNVTKDILSKYKECVANCTG